MPADSQDAPKVPTAVERFMKQLVVTLKAVMLYPTASNIPRENAATLAETLGAVLSELPSMRLGVQKNGFVYEGAPMFPGKPVYSGLAQELYNRGVADVRFHTGATADDLLKFLGLLSHEPEEIAASGGMDNRLWDLGVTGITVTEASARILEGELPASLEETPPDEEWPVSPARIEEILAGAMGGRPRDQRLLVRVLGDSRAMTSYLTETLAGRGMAPADALKEVRLGDLVRQADRSDRSVRSTLMRTIAAAVMDLEPELRRLLVAEKILPEARSDDAMAALVRQIDVDDLCELLVHGLSDDPESAAGLARAIRNLAQISLSEREEVINAVGAAMRTEGFAEEAIGGVLDSAAPSRLEVRERPTAQAADDSLDSILRLVDLAPSAVDARFEDDPSFMRLREEARRGISDGDVVASLVMLVAIDPLGQNFASIMALLEDNLELTVERGDYAIAADAVVALTQALEMQNLPDDRIHRITEAIGRFAAPRDLAAVTKAMRMFSPETPEHQACNRLIDALGERAIEPLLEILADEPDMTARKALVDIVSRVAANHADVLGNHLGDTRWYFVRNVAAILGNIRRASVLHHLGRTLRHGDARVRRETIRALSGIPDRLASEMLMAALQDADAQNVQLAARYLGTARVRGALAALTEVAKGTGRGNRDLGPRVEAIEALGHIGAVETITVLEHLASRRSLLGGARQRELKAAAEQAIEAIRAASARGEVVDDGRGANLR